MGKIVIAIIVTIVFGYVGIIIGANVAGILGMILAVPVCGIIKVILEKIDFGKKYDNVRYIAGAHHEYLDGSGYPDRINSSKLSILVRILTIMDVYESLTSSDRPYKKPLPKHIAYKILCEMVNEGKLDKDLVGLVGKFLNLEV